MGFRLSVTHVAVHAWQTMSAYDKLIQSNVMRAFCPHADES
jgi:hypothetical protein